VSSNSTKYVLLAVLFALVLFFASVATKFSGPKVQVQLTFIALVLLVIATIRMIVLPQYILNRPDAPPPVAEASASPSPG
jgi:hypothetical protein